MRSRGAPPFYVAVTSRMTLRVFIRPAKAMPSETLGAASNFHSVGHWLSASFGNWIKCVRFTPG